MRLDLSECFLSIPYFWLLANPKSSCGFFTEIQIFTKNKTFQLVIPQWLPLQPNHPWKHILNHLSREKYLELCLFC